MDGDHEEGKRWMQHVVNTDETVRMQASVGKAEILRQRFRRMIAVNMNETQRRPAGCARKFTFGQLGRIQRVKRKAVARQAMDVGVGQKPLEDLTAGPLEQIKSIGVLPLAEGQSPLR